ncbi:MAG: ANTAR domain-containing protein [Eubacterium sp.]|nr:ANTAR domain-containing protein [Eubacterium sp.]
MAKDTERQKSIIIVGGSEQFNTLVKKSLSGENYATIEIKRSAAAARRSLMERGYELVVIYAPLPDELGHQFALDVCTTYSSSVLMVTPNEIMKDVSEYVSDYGVVVLAKPVEYERLHRTLKFMAAVQERLHTANVKIRTLENKLREEKLIGRAKCILIEKKGMSEAEAHRYIGKRAMDESLTRKLVAEDIIDEYS